MSERLGGGWLPVEVKPRQFVVLQNNVKERSAQEHKDHLSQNYENTHHAHVGTHTTHKGVT